MKLYVEGLISALMTAFLAVSGAILFGVSQFREDAFWVIVYASAMASGYMYRGRHGPLIFASDGKGFRRLFLYMLGWGSVLGPAKLYFVDFPMTGVVPIVNALILLIAVPLSGLSVLGLLLAGSWVYGWKHEA